MSDAMSGMPHPGALGVCAIVVTFNRKELLRECLLALLRQTLPVARVLVIDNLSSDGTAAMLQSEFGPETSPQITVNTLPENRGGAGGFHEGMKLALEQPCEWLWLMDDDTIPHPDALERLVAARARFEEADRAPDLLGSKVIWTDGTLHPMNTQWVKRGPAEEHFLAARAGTFPLRTTTFVSMLIHRRLVREYGLPIASYFLGGDDVEYTARILKRELGVAVPDSIVTHKTPRKAGTIDAPAGKFYYYVRNTTWMLTRSSAFHGGEGTKLALRFLVSLGVYMKRTRFAGASLNAIGLGLWHGLTTKPTN